MSPDPNKLLATDGSCGKDDVIGHRAERSGVWSNENFLG